MLRDQRSELAHVSSDLVAARQYTVSRILPIVVVFCVAYAGYYAGRPQYFLYGGVPQLGIAVVLTFTWLYLRWRPNSEIPYMMIQVASAIFMVCSILPVFHPHLDYPLAYIVIQNLLWIQTVTIYSILNSFHVIYQRISTALLATLSALLIARLALTWSRGEGIELFLPIIQILAAAWATLFGIRKYTTQKEAYIHQSSQITLLEQLANSDVLTSLPNRRSLYRAIEGSIEQGVPRFAVMMIDIDNFKAINDTLGHAVGDRFLIAFAEFLGRYCQGGIVVAHLNGDEFALLLPGHDLAAALAVGRAIVSDLQAPESMATVRDGVSRITASIGLSVYPEDGLLGATLIKHADTALYAVKRNGKNSVVAYREIDHARLETEEAIIRELDFAIERGELRAVLQPIYDVATGSIPKVELLTRWHSQRLGFVSPAQFIPLAERSGMIISLGWWTLREGCRIAARHPELQVCVNISGAQLIFPGFVEGVKRVLREEHTLPSAIALEITETFFSGENALNEQIIAQLSAEGLDIMIDDFGVGYSNYDRLRKMPIRCLKIDKTFIDSLMESDADQAYTVEMIASLVRLGRIADFTVTAEGIEHASQLSMLRELGCQYGQGYLMAKPMPPEEMAKMLSAG